MSKQKSDRDDLNRITDPEFLDSLKGFGDAIRKTFSEALKTVGKIREELGTEVFDVSQIDEYIDRIDELSNAMSSYAKTVKNLNIKQFNVLQELINNSTMSLKNSKKEMLDIQSIFENIKSPLFEQLDNVNEKLKSIPMFGQLLGDAFNVEEIKKELGPKLKENIIENMKDGAVSMSSMMQASFDTIKSMAVGLGRVLKTVILNPWLLGIASIVLLIKKFIDLENKAQDFREATGQSYNSAKQLTKEIENTALSARMFGVEMQDAFDSAQSLISVIGSSKLITGKMATDLAVLSKLTGITSDNAAGVYKQFAASTGSTSQSAINMANTLAYTSQLMGVPMDIMFADVAESGEFIAQYIKDTGDGLIKAAAQARLLGLNMKDVENITSRIMDFEGSIERELMASILVGKQINFNRARYLAFNNQIGEATEEVMKQVGSLEEFNKLNPIAARAIADAVGITVEKLRDSLYIQKLINEAKGQERKDLERARDIVDGTIKMSEAERDALAKENLSNRSALKQMQDAWGQIGASLTKIVLPAINSISWALKGISDLVLVIFGAIDSLTGGTDTWVSKLIKTVGVIGAIITGLFTVKLLMGVISNLTSIILSAGGLGGVADGVSKGGGLLGNIFSGLNPKTILSAAFSILVISGALWVFGKALQEIDKVKDITTTLITASIGLIMLSTVALAFGSATPAMLLGAVTITILAGALWVFGKALNEFIPLIKVVLDGITGFAEVIGNTIVNIIGTVADSIKKIGDIDAINLMGVAAGIGAVGLSLAAFGGGSLAAGISSFISNFLGGDPIEKLKLLSTLGPGLLATAAGIQAVNIAMNKQIIPIDAIPEAINLPINASTTLNDTIKNGDNLIIEKLNQLIDAVNSKQDIYLDNRKVSTNLNRNIAPRKVN